MSPEVHSLLSPEIRDECFSRFGVRTARLIANWHAFTFEAETPAGSCILKITHSSHRTDDQLEAETDWLLFLASNGLSVPRITASMNSLSVERVPVGDSYFSGVSYERLVGERIGESLWTETLFRRWGALIGKLHRAQH